MKIIFSVTELKLCIFQILKKYYAEMLNNAEKNPQM